MAILGPTELPAIFKIDGQETLAMKKYVLTKLGHPTVEVEITEDQLESVLRVTGDFISHYFPREQKLAYFNTTPLQSEYPMPADAYWVEDVQWDPSVTRIGDVFGAECVVPNSIVRTSGGLTDAGNVRVGDEILSYDSNGEVIKSLISAKKFNEKKCYKISAGGRSIITSGDHLYLTDDGWRPLRLLRKSNVLFMFNHKTKLCRINSVEYMGVKETVDFQVDTTHNLIVNDFVVHNSFLFCHPGGGSILTTHGTMLCENLFQKIDTKIITAFNPHKARMRWNQRKQPITVLRTEKDFVACTPNHPVNCNGKMQPSDLCNIGDKLINHKDKFVEIIDKIEVNTEGTWSIQNKTGTAYMSALGREFYLVH